ncbi:MAG: hypothetical protein M3R06_02365 [Chloroflexota bacterium]|nr:hypothetical protein [Chloroflexota bacterium]
MSERIPFEPSRYLTKVNGADYLEVKWRLVWLRATHQDAKIETEMVNLADNVAVFRAKVELPNGGSATGWGTESAGDFRDFIEKAETKALGRALAALGFGTQFCPDFEFGASAGRVVDAPIDFASTRGRRLLDTSASADESQSPMEIPTATARQVNFIHAIAREAGLSDQAVQAESNEAYGRPIEALGRADASEFIERLQARRTGASLAS